VKCQRIFLRNSQVKVNMWPERLFIFHVWCVYMTLHGSMWYIE
jgi:hypothetical protein